MDDTSAMCHVTFSMIKPDIHHVNESLKKHTEKHVLFFMVFCFVCFASIKCSHFEMKAAMVEGGGLDGTLDLCPWRPRTSTKISHVFKNE